MKGRLIRACLTAVAIAGAAATSHAQQDPAYPNIPDNLPPIGVIEGKVRLTSGRPIGGSVKVILSTIQSILYTRYTNNEGEFRFTELREGVYYVQIAPDSESYTSVTQRILLGRG